MKSTLHPSVRTFATVGAALLLTGALLSPAAAQDRAASAATGGGPSDLEQMRNDIDALKKGQDAIQKSLDEIKALLRQNAAPRPAAQAVPNVMIDLKNHPMQGAPDAKLAIVEFSDYQCPYCARHTRETYPAIERDFIATGKLRYAMIDLPLSSHAFAFRAAEAATCAADVGKFWEMHHLLFENQNALNPEMLMTYADRLGLDRAEFEACLKEGRQQSVNADLQQATSAGISATPTFIVGWLGKDDQLKPAEVIRGAQAYASFAQVIDKLLKQGPPPSAGR